MAADITDNVAVSPWAIVMMYVPPRLLPALSPTQVPALTDYDQAPVIEPAQAPLLNPRALPALNANAIPSPSPAMLCLTAAQSSRTSRRSRLRP